MAAQESKILLLEIKLSIENFTYETLHEDYW